ncbi:hypothetical protein [uncultured Ruminococcus sp.]|uniref:hypothetical protein n=1 Tax=uncultured Ruminococcus sp. TaxID=165186 RepID=UPI002616C25F|nr:hypothetical protein [uncultured Ruminococcus sp.]
MKEKNANCVELNIYVECDKCSHDEPVVAECAEKHKENETCVKINVFVECDKKKCKYAL